jgi:hypothetical protein
MIGGTFIKFPVRRKGGVLLIACEGQSQVPIRTAAKFGAERAPFAWIENCPRLLDGDTSVRILTETVKEAADRMMQEFKLPPVLILIDTSGKAAGYRKAGDENDTALGKVLMKALGDLAIATRTFVFGLEHFGKDASVGTRGASSKEDDADVVLALLGEKDITGVVRNPRLCVRKVRSGPNGEEFPFSTTKVDMGTDANGAPMDTLVIKWAKECEPAPATPAHQTDPWNNKTIKQFGKVLRNLTLDEGRDMRPWNDSPQVRAVPCERLRESFYKQYAPKGETPKQQQLARNKAFNSAVSVAQERELIGVREIEDAVWVWFASDSRSRQSSETFSDERDIFDKDGVSETTALVPSFAGADDSSADGKQSKSAMFPTAKQPMTPDRDNRDNRDIRDIVSLVSPVPTPRHDDKTFGGLGDPHVLSRCLEGMSRSRDLGVANEAKMKIRVVRDCPPDTACMQCFQTGDVKQIVNADIAGCKSETLHERCATAWWKRVP